MSTRCNVIVKDSNFGAERSVMFYRHSDGYPSGVAQTLVEFLNLVKTSRIRDNVSQASGWLIMLGNEEYAKDGFGETLESMRANTRGINLNGWKVGAYEPATEIGSDIEYLYEIDLTAKTLHGWEHDGENKGKDVTAELQRHAEKAA